jgi:hypothetical protein
MSRITSDDRDITGMPEGNFIFYYSTMDKILCLKILKPEDGFEGHPNNERWDHGDGHVNLDEETDSGRNIAYDLDVSEFHRATDLVFFFTDRSLRRANAAHSLPDYTNRLGFSRPA